MFLLGGKIGDWNRACSQEFCTELEVHILPFEFSLRHFYTFVIFKRRFRINRSVAHVNGIYLWFEITHCKQTLYPILHPRNVYNKYCFKCCIWYMMTIALSSYLVTFVTLVTLSPSHELTQKDILTHIKNKY